jgi:hypothetical protein
VRGDVRSRRIAIVPDSVLNPGPGAPDRLPALAAAGWGVLALPPPGLDAAARAGWRDAVLDEVTAFLDGGYEVVLADPRDPESRALAHALRGAGRTVPPALDPAV